MTINDRIAKAKGWEFRAAARAYVSPDGRLYTDELPDYVGTLEGVAGMMRELNEKARKDEQYWWWGVNVLRLVDAPYGAFICVRHGIDALFLIPWFWSPDDRPGDCVGDAYMSVFGEELGDGD